MKSAVRMVALAAVMVGAMMASARAEVVTLLCVGNGFLGGEGRLLIDTTKRQMSTVTEGSYTNSQGFNCKSQMTVDESAYRMEEKCTKQDDWTLEVQMIDRITGRYIFSRSTKDLVQKSYISECKKVDMQPKF